MDLTSLEGYADAVKVFEANVSPRYRALTNLDAWANGKQYNGLPDWFSIDKPLWERAPCIVYLLTKESIESKVDLVLGEGRFPDITTSPGEGDPLAEAEGAAADDESGLKKADSKLIDAFIGRAMKQSGFAPATREALHHAQEVSSSVLIFGVRKAKLFCDTTKAQWCEPTLDVDGACLRLEIKYPYLDPYKDQFGKWKVRVRIFRRVIDDKSDTTFLPAEANPEGIEPLKWTADPKQVFTHGFGFCPVIWYPFLRGCSTANQIDGKAPHELLLDEIRALDFAISQRHRAALYAGDPQWTECGVTPGFNPSRNGETASIPGTALGGQINPVSNPQTTSFKDPPKNTQAARLKSPGAVWQYPDKDTKVALHTLPGDALESLTKHATDLRLKLCEMLAHVPLDPDATSHIRQLSAKAIEALRKRELNRCDRIRDDFGDICLVPAVQILLRICAFYIGKGEGLNLAGLKKVAPILKRYLGTDVSLRLVWGDYATPDPTEETAIVSSTVQAHEAGLITDRAAVTKLRAIYDIENIDEFLKALELEKKKRQEDALAQTTAEQASLHAIVKDGDDGDRASSRAGKKEPKGASSGRGGSAASADASA